LIIQLGWRDERVKARGRRHEGQVTSDEGFLALKIRKSIKQNREFD
jgi:hypothetical protein